MLKNYGNATNVGKHVLYCIYILWKNILMTFILAKKKKSEKLCIGVDFGDGLVFNQ